jgi:sugar phosphate isomerase/epimerase
MSMKTSFSTLACPTWTLPRVIEIAVSSGYDGVELRFLEGEDSLWKLPTFIASGLAAATRMISDNGLTITCVGTSCRFHSPDRSERDRWIEEGKRMAELAAALGSPGIRVFGDKIQLGADRNSTRDWITEGVRRLAEEMKENGVEVWLETHGDFASSAETMRIVESADCPNVGVVWDPANCFTDGKEYPSEAVHAFGTALRHVHLRDLHSHNGMWEPVPTGSGQFPLREILAKLKEIGYERFVSFEWEKKWRPELAEPELAIPQFAGWFRQNG